MTKRICICGTERCSAIVLKNTLSLTPILHAHGYPRVQHIPLCHTLWNHIEVETAETHTLLNTEIKSSVGLE